MIRCAPSISPLMRFSLLVFTHKILSSPSDTHSQVGTVFLMKAIPTESSRTMLIKYTTIYVSRTVLYTAYKKKTLLSSHCSWCVQCHYERTKEGGVGFRSLRFIRVLRNNLFVLYEYKLF